jgi:hypothetical protein
MPLDLENSHIRETLDTLNRLEPKIVERRQVSIVKDKD